MLFLKIYFLALAVLAGWPLLRGWSALKAGEEDNLSMPESASGDLNARTRDTAHCLSLSCCMSLYNHPAELGLVNSQMTDTQHNHTATEPEPAAAALLFC